MKRSNDQKGSGTGLFNESSSSEIVVLHDTGGNRWLRPVSKKKAVAAIAPAVILIVFIFFSFSLVIMLSAGWINVSNNENARLIKTTTCPRNYTYSTSWSSLINPSDPVVSNTTTTTVSTCPSYFRWIHEDLGHWKESGITKEMVERAQRTAHFRLVIVEGKAYVKKYRKSLQSRDMFSIWGILQLLRFYPGRLPDLELMFDCNDRPVVRMRDFRAPNPRPPPLFRYCSDRWSMDIVFPDWSFWGW